MKRVLCGLAVVLFGTGAFGGDWPQFRGPGGRGVSDETDLPVRWSATENIAWKVDLPGRGLSSPVVAGDQVYLTACTGPKQERLHVLCFAAATGKKLWQRQFWATGSTLCNPKTCVAAPTPATDGQRVYALFASGDLVCLTKDGDLVWLRSLCRDYPTLGNNVGMASSPVLFRKVLLLALENAGESYALGLDKLTGKNRWQVERRREINWVTPLVINNGGRDEVLFQSPREISAYHPETGRKFWTYAAPGLSTIPSPAFGDGRVFVPGGKFLAFRPGREGKPPRQLWATPKLQTSFASPLFYQGRLYTVNGVGVLSCTEAATGKVLGRLRLKGPFASSPVAAGGKIYLVNEGGITSVVKAAARPNLLATNELPETILATPALARGAIYLRSDRRLYCIRVKKK
jgi:outer membrane protein assembly factor BamB